MSEGTERKSNRDVFDRLPEDCLYYISTFGSALTLLRLPTLSKTFKAFVSEFSHEIFAHGLRTCFLPMYEINWPTRPPKSQRGDISKMKWSPEKFFRKLYKCIKKEFGEKALRRDPAVITHSRGYVGQPSSIVNLFERYYCWMRAEEENFSSLQLSNCPNCAAVESTLATTWHCWISSKSTIPPKLSLRGAGIPRKERTRSRSRAAASVDSTAAFRSTSWACVRANNINVTSTMTTTQSRSARRPIAPILFAKAASIEITTLIFTLILNANFAGEMSNASVVYAISALKETNLVFFSLFGVNVAT